VPERAIRGRLSPGFRNAITDVPLIRVGHAHRTVAGFLTGTTVVLPPPTGFLSAVDVRGGGPATQDTAALDPRHGGSLAHAVVLTGGSAYGLAAAAGVLEWLTADGRGLRLEPESPGIVIPLVPTAALFDLGRGGDVGARPDAAFGLEAVRNAASSPEHAPLVQGNVGAGTGAVTAEMKGGIGSASTVLSEGVVVGALAAVNAHGSVLDAATGLPLALRAGAEGEFEVQLPDAAEHAAAKAFLAEPGRPPAALNLPNTVIGVVATNAPLDAAQTYRLAVVAHSGLASAVSPVHGPTDGDTVFALAQDGRRDVARIGDQLFVELLDATVTTFARAVVHGILQAQSVTTPFGHIASYRELYPRATAVR
jgi:putative pantetheine hydrolase